MKLVLAFALLASLATFANDHQAAAPAVAPTAPAAPVVEQKHADKKEAYKAAKEACLKENKDLKGKELKDCIVKQQAK